MPKHFGNNIKIRIGHIPESFGLTQECRALCAVLLSHYKKSPSEIKDVLVHELLAEAEDAQHNPAKLTPTGRHYPTALAHAIRNMRERFPKIDPTLPPPPPEA